MIANTSSIPTLKGAGITLETVTKPCMVKERKTKILCTLGPACWSEEGLAALMDAGMNCARFNFSHGDHEGHTAVLERLRKVAKQKKRNIAVLMDTKGPEIRSGFFANDAKKIDLVKGETITLTGDYSFKGDSKKLACSYPSLAKSVTPDQQILVADGSLVLTVLTVNKGDGTVDCRIENNCSIGERKNMNLPGVKVDLPTFTEKDRNDIINWACKYKVDFIAASFVQDARDVTDLRKMCAENGGGHIKIICKMENQEGLANYEEILKETDAIMVARGDLGMEIPASKVFLAQKYMIREANLKGVPVVTATQMLESMITNPRPTRAECSDVANAVFDGTDGVMLSGETANGPYFRQAVEVMAKTCCEAESSRNYNILYQSIRNSILSYRNVLSVGESVSSSAVKSALDVNAKLIIVMTQTGKMANYVAKFRPPVSVLMMTPMQSAARQGSAILAGVHSVAVDSLEKSDELIEEICFHMVASKINIKEGDEIVVCGGRMAGMKEQIRVFTVTKGKDYGRIKSDDTFFFDPSMMFSFVPERY